MIAESVSESCAGRLQSEFMQLYGTVPRLFRAPGRVNLIGEHTDYNSGFAMPVAIQFYAYAAIAPRLDRRIRVYSRNFEESVEFGVDENGAGPRHHWSDYLRGVAGVMGAQGVPIHGADMMIASQVPVGAGLASSAAIEVSSALALLSMSGRELALIDIARNCQKAEHEYAGSMCGIMDQYIACFGRSDHAIMLDCRDLVHEFVPTSLDVRIVICNTGVKHEHASSAYNRRRSDCYAGVSAIQSCYLPEINALRDLSSSVLENCKDCLPEVVYRRCRHVVTENDRVIAAARQLKAGDMKSFGELMYQSHSSLRNDYEVSCGELDLLVEIAQKIDGVYGARMTGGGFGGCTVNLVEADAVDEFTAITRREFARVTANTPDIYVCTAAQGAGGHVVMERQCQ